MVGPSKMLSEIEEAIIYEKEELKQALQEERNTSLLHDLEFEDRLKDKEDERKYFNEQTDQKENELAMRINY